MREAAAGITVKHRKTLRAMQLGERATITVTVDADCGQCEGTGLTVSVAHLPGPGGPFANFHTVGCPCIGIIGNGEMVPRWPGTGSDISDIPDEEKIAGWRTLIDNLTKMIADVEQRVAAAESQRSADG
jgi:hypothetical protein